MHKYLATRVQVENGNAHRTILYQALTYVETTLPTNSTNN